MNESGVDLFTFLGTGKYKETTYFIEKPNETKEYSTNLIALALNEFFSPQKVYAFVTEKSAKTEHMDKLKQELGDSLEPVRIPNVDSEDSLWEVFAIITATVQERPQNRKILFDITHAFRSLPFVVFTVLAYIRQVKEIPLEGVWYGAFEVGGEQRSPVIDLCPLVDMLDWIHGATCLEEYGDGQPLGNKLQQIHNQSWRGSSGHEGAKFLQQLGEAAKNFRRAFNLSRPLELMKQAHVFNENLVKTEEEVKKWAPPFEYVTSDVRQELEQVISGDITTEAENPILSRQMLSKQLGLIKYWIDRDMVMQGISLMKEWMINWLIFMKSEITGDQVLKDNWLELTTRHDETKEPFDKMLHDYINSSEKKNILDFVPDEQDWIEDIPDLDDFRRLWAKISRYRNNLAHCGFREDTINTSKIYNKAREFLDGLYGLPLKID